MRSMFGAGVGVGVVELFSPCNAALNVIFSFALISLRRMYLVAHFNCVYAVVWMLVSCVTSMCRRRLVCGLCFRNFLVILTC